MPPSASERSASVSDREDASSDSEAYVNVKQDGSRKRRKLSSGSDEELVHPVGALSASTVSRIKPKQNGLSHEHSEAATSVNGIALDEQTNFAALGVDSWLVASLAAMAIKKPTGIQKACIPEILGGKDCIGGSKTGSGKTVAFAVPILQQWARDPVGIFAVVLTPTRHVYTLWHPHTQLTWLRRELALQIFEQFKAISAPQCLKPILVTGGADMRTQALALAQRPHVVIATPGRLADHIRNSGEDTICGLRRVRFAVLDEADRLLAPGPGSMLDDLGTCFSVLPPKAARQTCLFTATVTDEVRALKEGPRPPGKPPAFVCEVGMEELAVPATLRQTYVKLNVTQRESYLHVLLLTPANAGRSAIVFCNRTATATYLEHVLRLLAHRVTALHAGLPQPARVANLARFRAGAARILVASDVAARGLDIPAVALVVNYDMPRNPDDYIHRIGRTARAGRGGESVSLVGQRDVRLLLATEQRVGRRMEEYAEEGVNLETRVLKELNAVSKRRREALLRLEEGRDVKGKRKTGMAKRAKS